MTKYNITSIATATFALLFTGIILFNCSGGGKGGDRKDHMRKEYGRDPEGFRKKWGV